MARDHEPVTLTDGGRPVAVLISAENLAALQQTQDEADLANLPSYHGTLRAGDAS